MRSPRAILQMEAAECGAACLAMVLSAHGREITLEEARGRCATSRDGVDAGALGVAAESYGMKFKAVRAEPESLKDLPLPAILHWNFNHFVVLVKAGGGGFWLLDPASGRRKVSKAELSKSFTGLALAMVPGPHFERGGQKASSLGRLIAHARGSWDGMAVVALCGIACVIPGLIISGAIQVFVDHVAGKARFDWLVAVLAALLIAVTAQAGLEYLRARVVANMKSKIGVVIAARGFHRALLLPLAFFAQRSAGELVSRLRIGSEIGGTIVGPVSQLMPSAMMAGCYIAVLALQDPLLGSVVLGISVLSILVLVRLSTRLSEATRLNSVLEGQANGISTAGFAAFDAFRLLGRCDLFESRWLAAEEKAIDAGQRLGTLRLVATIAPGAATLLIVMTVLIIGAARVMHGDLTLGGLLALQVLAGMIGAPVAVIAQSWCAIQEASGAIARLDDLHRYPVDPQFAGDQIAPKIAPVPEGAPLALKLDGIRFGFRADTSVLKDVSLQIAPGEIVALMGPSGAGKSTLAKLAAGMVQPDAGTIYLGGAPLIDWPGHALRAKLQYVPQMAALVTGTLRDNITMWDPAIGDEAIADALEHANAAEFVQRAGGLYAQISAERPCLSGGERQRLALVRALVRQPVILVLDETTSALDTLSEAQVLAGLRRTGAGILLVTHRNGSAARCDRVLALDGAGGFAPRASAVVFAERYGT